MEGDDWEDLFAVVRGSISTSKSPITTAAVRDPFSSLPKPYYQTRPNPLHYYSNPPDPCRSSRTAMQELEELCKPFLRPQPPPQHHHHHHHLKGSLTSSSYRPQPFFSRHPQPRLPSHGPSRTRRRQTPSRPFFHVCLLLLDGDEISDVGLCRKNQQKRVVREVPADGLSSDVWAWRKYGQKPIKGSPFPRGYYRCSSSKGCLARKQVERSGKNPNMFVITYTGEHSHPVPTHRNSLAGSTRQKSGSSASASGLVKAKGTGEGAKVATSSGSEVTTVEDQKKGGEGEEQVQQLEVGVGEEVEIDEVQEEEEEEGTVLMRELEMLGEEEMMFVGFDDMDASIGI